MKLYTFLVVLLGLSLAPVSALAQSDSDEWQFQLTPYLWLPTIDGALNYAPPPGGGGAPEISVGPTDWLKLINAGLLINGEARKGRLSIFADIVYLSMQNNNDSRVRSVDADIPAGPITIPVSGSINVNTQTDLDGLV